MKAMVLEKPGEPLVYKSLPVPVPSPQQVLIKVIACGICRTDLHVVDGELELPKLPLIPGHEVIGQVVTKGKKVTKLKIGDVVGVPWLGYTCGKCKFCLKEKENLCSEALFTGYTLNGGYAQYMTANEDFAFLVPKVYANPSGAPLLCAGLIGYRSYNIIKAEAGNIGIYGFVAAAHILIQVALFQKKKVFAFTRPGDEAAQHFALKLGAKWTGDSTIAPPVKLDAAIIFAPAGSLVPKALRDLEKGGTVVCGGINMSDIPAFPYSILWGERIVRSVANLTRHDAKSFFEVANKVKIETAVKIYRLEQANEALANLRNGKLQGAAVLVME